MANITRAQVFTAADQISNAGQQPTVAGIRAKLGSGSYTTITAMLREWKEQAETPADDSLDVPEEITQALGRAAEIVWKAAQDHFRHELATVRKESDRLISSAQAQTNDALQEIARLEQALDDTIADNVKVTQALENSQEKVNHCLAAVAGYQAELRAAHARIDEQADLLRRFAPSVPKSADVEPVQVAPVKRAPAKRKAEKITPPCPADAPEINGELSI